VFDSETKTAVSWQKTFTPVAVLIHGRRRFYIGYVDKGDGSTKSYYSLAVANNRYIENDQTD
jgi:hypothetical protein